MEIYCFCFVLLCINFDGNFQLQALGGLIFGGAISWKVFCVTSLEGLYLEGLIYGGLTCIFGTLRYLLIMLCSRKTPFLLGLPDRVSFIVNNKVIHI